jgi:N-methylhydantoinase A
MQRGHDPESVALVAFGGAGGLHATALAELLGMPSALVPRHPGALSARGMSTADAIREHSHSVLGLLREWPAARRRTLLRELAQRGKEELVSCGHRAREVRFEHGLDLRYRGQSYELRVADGPRAEDSFHDAHERLYGYRLEDREVELVCLRTRAIVPEPRPCGPGIRRRKLPASAIVDHRPALFADTRRARRTPVIDRARLAPGHGFDGPALVEEYTGTTLVPPGWRATVRPGGHLMLERCATKR